MSTRATYLFDQTSMQPAVCYYIHHDGYKEGAACYFRNMLNAANGRGGYAAAFLRGNYNAEFTGGHNAHGDTEYRYTVAADGSLRVDNRVPGGEWKSAYIGGKVWQFVNEYDTDGELFVPYANKHGYTVHMELPAALTRLKHARESLIIQMMNQGASANIASAFDDFEAAVKGVTGAAIPHGSTRAAACMAEMRIIMEQLVELAKAHAAVLGKQREYNAMGYEDLKQLAEERGITNVDVPTFGSASWPLRAALSRHDYRTAFAGFATRRVLLTFAGTKFEMDVPVGVDACQWLNFGRQGGERYKPEEITELDC